MSDIDVEYIIREVIRRLMAMANEPSRNDGQAVRLTQRLVTMATLEGRLANAKRLIVPKNALVTPLVKDELKSRKIILEYEH
ncbi:MAG: hypothetical protein IAG10_19075 [Planctomycetaceae bacterium]|nr:hypothetical protein [Planctomycetaceae bacterium]